MRDIDVRTALRGQVDSHFRDEPGTIRIDELGVLNGSSRIDLAVINGSLHGYEIKSATDTLDRLPSQIEAYSSVFDTVTLVVADSHASDAIALIPQWWGVCIAMEGSAGAVELRWQRKPGRNPAVDPVSLASLLWRDELIAVLVARGVRGVKKKNREELHQIAAEEIPVLQLKELVRSALKTREQWRPDAKRM
jgi:hypothetical protein